jgi:hypothetical protein
MILEPTTEVPAKNVCRMEETEVATNYGPPAKDLIEEAATKVLVAS